MQGAYIYMEHPESGQVVTLSRLSLRADWANPSTHPNTWRRADGYQTRSTTRCVPALRDHYATFLAGADLDSACAAASSDRMLS
ncbi:hypothetical protein B2J77_10965 [Pseudomonas parafulva]|uniref:Uncharacterized protein n=1 Tax=Pseudomonas parafulva TaxID=157782 RepID=A0ABN4XW29_9PSED|nr:hypothetical protein B2J77_10965 [Pseudomonas parafulva]